MSVPQIGTLHRKWKKEAFFLETVVLTKVTRRRYFAGRIAAKKPRSAVVATHERELGKVKISPTIGLYTLIHKKQKLGVLSELDMEPSHDQLVVNGRSRGIRTHDPVIKSHLLYQLSYAPIHRFHNPKNGAS